MPRKPPNPRIKAVELLGRWTRLAQRHLPFGAGCSCGATVTIRLVDLERDVLDYLASRHDGARSATSIADLLKKIATQPGDSYGLLGDLERSLASFEETHR